MAGDAPRSRSGGPTRGGSALSLTSAGREALLEQVMRHAAVGMALVTPEGRFLEVNPALCRLLGRDEQALGQMLLRDVTHPDDLDESLDLVREIVAGRLDSFQLEKRYIHADGHVICGQVSVSCLRQQEQPEVLFIVQILDLSSTKQALQALQTDPLTGLANRGVMVAQLEAVLVERSGASELLAILSIGIDRLTQINDALTHRAGDLLIATLAARLAEAVPPAALLARGTADTFVLLMPGLGSVAEAATLAERLRLACKGVLSYGDHQIEPSVSIGIAIAEAAQDADELLRDASLAMRQAAAEGRDRVAFGEQAFADGARGELVLQARIRAALESDAFQAWFMPQVDLDTGELRGYEALVRWLQPDGSVAMPDTFLPAASRASLAAQIDLAVLRQSLTALASLPPHLFVAANVTPSTLSHPGLADTVRQWLEQDGLPATRLHLEITESDLLTLTPAVRATFEELAALGVRWLIDDFGTGFSSISHLRDLPIHAIKLDRSFTAAIAKGDQKSVRLAQALAGLAEGLGLDTVAEGVESAAEAAFLLDLGWNRGQGWLYGKAAPLDPDPSIACSLPPGPSSIPALPPVLPIAPAELKLVRSRSSWALAVTESVPVGLYALRISAAGDKEFLFVSRRWLEMLRLTREEVLAQESLAFNRVHPEDRDSFGQHWQASIDAGETLYWEGRLLIEGSVSWVRIEGIPQPQSDGSCVWQGVMSDITALKHKELDLQRLLDNAPIAIALNSLTDADPAITYVNRQFVRTLGYGRDTIPRLSDWSRLAYPDPAYRARIMERWAEALELARQQEGTVGTLEAEVMTADGRRLAVVFSAVVLEEMLVVSMLDITQRRQAEEQLQQARLQLAETALAVTEAIPVGTYTMLQPPDGGMASFAFMSERFLAICGLEREAAAADPFNAFACVHPDDYDAWLARNAEAFATRLPFYGETRIVVDGEVRWISAESIPRQLSDGSVVWEGVLIDITERICTQRRLQDNESRLRRILDSLLDPHITLEPLRDAAGRPVEFVCRDANQAAGADLQLPREQLLGRSLAALLPAEPAIDLPGQCAVVLESGAPLALNEVPFRREALGRQGWLDLRVVRVGEALSCTWRDVSDRVEAARRLAASELQYRLLAENSSDVVMQLTGDGTIVWVSPSLTATLGWKPEEWVGRLSTEFLEHEGNASHYRDNLEALRAGRTVVARDRVRARDGRWHWAETHASPFRNSSGEIDGIVSSFRTIDAEVKAEQELARLARTDELTGLLSRREVLARIDSFTSHSPRNGQRTAALFCDLDAFKPVNDRYGHATGDELLRVLAKRIRDCLRSQDLAARLGGDELLVVLQGVQDLDNAVAIAEKIREAAQAPVATVAGELQISLSIGVTLAQPGESSDALIARADAGMYEAKRVGRNCVIPIPADGPTAGIAPAPNPVADLANPTRP